MSVVVLRCVREPALEGEPLAAVGCVADHRATERGRLGEDRLVLRPASVVDHEHGEMLAHRSEVDDQAQELRVRLIGRDEHDHDALAAVAVLVGKLDGMYKMSLVPR